MSGYYKDEHRYDDIMDLLHHQSKEQTHMSLHDRAAQFAPFAALAGHEEAIEETARLTDEKIMLDKCVHDIFQAGYSKIRRGISYGCGNGQKYG